MKKVEELNLFELSILKTHESNIDQVDECEIDFNNCNISIKYKQPVETQNITFRHIRSKEELDECKSNE